MLYGNIINFPLLNFANIFMTHSFAGHHHPSRWRLFLLLFARRLSHVSCSNEQMVGSRQIGELVGWWVLDDLDDRMRRHSSRTRKKAGDFLTKKGQNSTLHMWH